MCSHGSVLSENIRAYRVSSQRKSTGLVQSVLCENCDVPHDAEIVFEDGSYCHYCPDLGVVAIERADLVTVRPNLVALVEHLHAAFECPPGGISQLGPQTWRVGLVDTPGGRAVVYFQTCLRTADDLVSLGNAMDAQIRRDYVLVVSSVGQLPYRDASICNLAEMVKLDLGTARLRKIVRVAEAVGAPPRTTGGRPSIYRERLHALLAERSAQGLAADGRNAEADAVRAAYVARFPHDPAPSRVTVQRSVSKFRTGS